MKKVISMIVMSAVLGSSAFAQTAPAAPGGESTYPGTAKPAAVSFDSLDKNKDGAVSKDEAKINVTIVAAFDTADKNGDGVLNKTEFDAYFSKR